MKTIIEGQTNIIKLLGLQNMQDTEYRRMKYLLLRKCDDGLLLHNVITGELVLLNEEEESIFNALPSKCNAMMDELIKKYFLVPVDYDEKKNVDNLRKLLTRLLSHDGINEFTILTTTCCNARCFYCYESDLPHINMSEAIANELLEYINKNRGKKNVILQWFGGEPLVCAERIDQICEGLDKREIKYISSMTSNGFLFNEEVIERAVKLWKLQNVQITIDGTEGIYNKTKAYVSKEKSPYNRVIRNIQSLLKRNIRVVIRLNLDLHNAENLFDLVDELSERFENKNNLEVYSHILFEGVGFKPIDRDLRSKEMLYQAQEVLSNKIEKLGMTDVRRRIPFLKTHSCMADAENSVVVYPDGSLFKCEHIRMGDVFGHIDGSITNADRIEQFMETMDKKECNACSLYPSCIKLKKCPGSKELNVRNCEYDINSIERAMEEHYRYSLIKRQKHDC